MFKAFLFTLLLSTSICFSQQKPGDEPYQPTRLEWGALYLSTTNGQLIRETDNPSKILMISFIPYYDGVSIVCFLQYSKNYPGGSLKNFKDVISSNFEAFRKNQGWDWLRLNFKEETFDETK